MSSPVEFDTLPEWLRPMVQASDKFDLGVLGRFQPPRGQPFRAAAVLVLFGEGPHGPDVLLLRRADGLDAHAGQVAFPGGGAEAGDDGPLDTALREAEEETGVVPSGVHPVAVLPRLFVPVSGFAVTPVLAYWKTSSPVRVVDPRETAAVARVPIADLVDPANRYQVRRANWHGPAFEVDGLFVWGFTAALLANLLDMGGLARDWDQSDVRDLDEVLAKHGIDERIPDRRSKEQGPA